MAHVSKSGSFRTDDKDKIGASLQILPLYFCYTCCRIEDKVKNMEARIMTLVEESCMLSARVDPDDETAPKNENDLGKVLKKKIVSSKFKMFVFAN